MHSKWKVIFPNPIKDPGILKQRTFLEMVLKPSESSLGASTLFENHQFP